MPNIVITGDELVARATVIRQFLRPIANAREVACTSVPVRSGRVIAAHDRIKTLDAYRDWRFRSTCRDIQCQYFELWNALATGREWFLDRAYLHLFWIDREARTESELIAVHADPNNKDEAPLQTIRRGPHLHVKRLEEWLRHAHFSLTLGYVEEVTASAGEFTRVFSEAVKLVASEVIERAEGG